MMTEPTPVALSRAQRAVLDQLCATGGTNKEIGDDLGIAVETVKTHLADIAVAMGVSGSRKILALALNGKVEIVDKLGPVRRQKATPNRAPAVHLGPRPHEVLLATRCCHRLVDDLSDTDVVTSLSRNVTCGGPR